MQNKAIRKHHFTPTKTAEIQKQQRQALTSVGKVVERLEPSYIAVNWCGRRAEASLVKDNLKLFENWKSKDEQLEGWIWHYWEGKTGRSSFELEWVCVVGHGFYLACLKLRWLLDICEIIENRYGSLHRDQIYMVPGTELPNACSFLRDKSTGSVFDSFEVTLSQLLDGPWMVGGHLKD